MISSIRHSIITKTHQHVKSVPLPLFLQQDPPVGDPPEKEEPVDEPGKKDPPIREPSQ
ncbi:hypothetical protein K501DRAFT_283747 [Backusella circina FSU 941]|nr:hypothetical protein K501DRAFT_283747 [Backusella circina FSU 941]